jgi:hypothetical protein
MCNKVSSKRGFGKEIVKKVINQLINKYYPTKL